MPSGAESVGCCRDNPRPGLHSGASSISLHLGVVLRGALFALGEMTVPGEGAVCVTKGPVAFHSALWSVGRGGWPRVLEVGLGAQHSRTSARCARSRPRSEVRPFDSHGFTSRVKSGLRARRIRRIRDGHYGSKLPVEIGTREADQFDALSHLERHYVVYDTTCLRSLDFAGLEDPPSASVRMPE